MIANSLWYCRPYEPGLQADGNEMTGLLQQDRQERTTTDAPDGRSCLRATHLHMPCSLTHVDSQCIAWALASDLCTSANMLIWALASNFCTSANMLDWALALDLQTGRLCFLGH